MYSAFQNKHIKQPGNKKKNGEKFIGSRELLWKAGDWTGSMRPSILKNVAFLGYTIKQGRNTA